MKTAPTFEHQSRSARPRSLSFSCMALVFVAAFLNGGSSIADEGGFAVAELFTSEGCSSCPPADRVLQDLATKAEKENLEIYALSFHVDYWNRLGWTDPFSSADFSKRQRLYAGVLQESRIYTPQLIVNGRTSFVGSNRKQADAVIMAALNNTRGRRLDVDVRQADRSVTATAECDHADDGMLLNFALVQKQGTIEVPRGENANRTLTHRNIVRDFKVVNAKSGHGKALLKIPASVKQQDLTIVAYLQAADTGEVLAARRVALPNSVETSLGRR